MDLVNAALESVGYHFKLESDESSFEYETNKVVGDNGRATLNCLNVVGYIQYTPLTYISLIGKLPLIGQIAGVARMVFAVANAVGKIQKGKLKGEDIYFAAFQIARGAFETFGLGYLLTITDLIVTVGRLIHNEIKKRQEADSF